MKRSLFYFIISTIIILLSTDTLSYAQDDILWLHYFNRYKLSYKFSIDSDLGYRVYFPEGDRWQLRSGLRYDINENMYVRSGLMYVNGTAAKEEIRPYQDFVINSKFSVFTLTQRVRFEEQFYTNSSKTKFRLRYNPSIKFSTFAGYVTLGTEPFIVMNDPNSRISSNRVYVGITRRAYKNVLITLQYINERSYTKEETGYIQETNMIRVKVAHTIRPLRTGPLFGRKKQNS